MRRRSRAALAWPLFGLSLLPLIAGSGAATAATAPSGGAVKAGEASIVSNSGGVTVNQKSSKAIIDWRTFSIGAGQTAQFNNGSGATLNRVTGSGVSSIDGLLSATGSVYLLNPNGVIIGKDGVVKVGGGFVASTLDISDADFLKGGALSFTGNSSASVINLGSIGALGGDVVLAASTVRNDGQILAPKGDVGLLAGVGVTLRDMAQNDGKFVVNLGSSADSATNTGTIQAAMAELRANGGNVYALAGNMGGVISATGVSTNDGRVILFAEGGETVAHGQITAAKSDVTGGQVETSGAKVNFDGLRVRAANWLIDPTDLTVDAAAAATISANLDTTSVTLQTTATGASGPGVANNSGVGDIIIRAPITWSTGNTLTLDAYHGISILAPITASGAGKVVLTTNDGGTGGDYDFGLTGSGFTGSLNFTGTPNSGQALTINGQAYTLLYSMADLQNINAGLAGHYALATSLDATGITNWTPLGTDGASGIVNGHGFTGGFTGLGHAVSNLNITLPNTAFVGLFGYTSGSTLRDIGVGGSVSGTTYVGGLVGYDGGGSSIKNAHATGSVSGSDRVGGLVGELYNYSSITNAYATGSVSGSGDYVGGLVGAGSYLTLQNALASGVVSGRSYVGGLLGQSVGGNISSVAATGNVSGQNWVGGLIGLSRSDHITGSTAGFSEARLLADPRLQRQTVTSTGFATGGLVGGLYDYSTIDQSTAYADVHANGDTSVNQYAGGLVGIAYNQGDTASYAQITNSNAFGNVWGYGNVGGLIGTSYVSVSNAHAYGDVTGVTYVGGLIGNATPYSGANVKIDDSSASGAVTATVDYVGGLIGAGSYTTIQNAMASGRVTGDSDVGGLVGWADSNSTISNAYATGSVSGSGNFVGGLVGWAHYYSTISNAYATGSVSGNYDVGGLVGVAYSNSTIFNAYATGSVSGYYSLGGLVGWNDGSVSNTYATGSVSGNYNVGGLVGWNYGSVGGSYWDTETTGQSTSAGGTGLTTAQFFNTANFSGWNFGTTPGGAGWVMVDLDGTLNNANGAAGGSRPMLLSEYSTQINTGHQLQLMALDLSANYTLNRNIDLSATAGGADVWSSASGFIPVAGINSNGFTGGLEGAGHTLSGLFIHDTTSTPYINPDNNTGLGRVGLFGTIGAGGSVSNLTLANASVSGGDSMAVGILAGYAGGVISNVTTSGSVSTGNEARASDINAVGGVVGLLYGNGQIKGSSSSATVAGGVSSAAGGLAGVVAGASTISTSFATGTVTVGDSATFNTYSSYAGGLVGFAAAPDASQSITIQDSYATGQVFGGSHSLIGGFAGLLQYGLVSRSYASGSVTLTAGGKSTAGSGADFAGGFAGYVGPGGAISNSYATGPVFAIGGAPGAFTYAGGVIGLGQQETLSSVYSTGAVLMQGPGGYAVLGGLLGVDAGGTISHGYWDVNTSGRSLGIGYRISLANAVDVAGLTTAQLQGGLPGGFDPGVWGTGSGLYPYLKAFWATAPQAISGYGYGADGAAAVGALVNLYAGGTTLGGGATYTGVNGYFYKLVSGGTVNGATKLGETLTLNGGNSVSGLSYADQATLAGGNVSAPSVKAGVAAYTTANTTLSGLNADVSATFGSSFGALNASLTAASAATRIAANGAFTVDQALSSGGRVLLQANGDLTIGANGSVISTASGDAVTLAADGSFINNAGSSAVGAANGRWLIYTQASGAPGSEAPANIFGGLNGKSYYGDQFNFSTSAFATSVNAGNRFVYGFRPTLTVTPDTKSVVYNGQIQTDTYGVSGLRAADSLTDAIGGDLTGLSTASKNVGAYTLKAGSSGASDLNYNVQFASGVLTVTPAQLTASLIGPIKKTYDGTTAAFLANGVLNLSGVIGADAVTVSGAATGTYDNKNAGSGKLVTVSGLTLSGGDAGNYLLSSSQVSGAVGVIDPKSLTISLIGSTRKTYDGTTSIALTSANFTLPYGIVQGDLVALIAPATGVLDTKHVGSGKMVTAVGTSFTGPDGGNYVLSGPVTGAIAQVDKAALTLTATSNTKVYDGGLSAAAAPQITGLAAGDTVTGLSETYSDKSVGTGKILSIAAGYSVNDGNGGGDYTVTTVSSNTGVITKKALTATLTGTVSKVYDGTTKAILTSSNYGGLSGLVANDNVVLNNPVTGVYADKNAATGKLVTVSGLAISGADAGNYQLTSTTSSATVGVITPKVLTQTLIGSVSKVYDGATTATLSAANFAALSGVIAGDTVSVNKPTTGAYADKNAGTGKSVTVSGLALTGVSAGNYSLASSTVTGNIGAITKKALASSLTGVVSRVYNGTTAATLTSANLNLSGVVAGDIVSASGTGTFDTKNVGSAKVVTAKTETLTGADAANYTVSLAPALAIGEITPASLTIAAVANTKVYDGTTNAAAAPKVTGLVTGDTLSSLSESYADKNAGTGKTINVNSGYVINDGNGGANYTVTVNSITTGVITPKALTSALTGAVSKVYDGTTSATLGSGNFILTGVVAGDIVNATGTGTFNTKNVGTAKTITVVTEVLDNANYTVAKAPAAAIGTITPASLTLTAVANTKTYDGSLIAAAIPTISGLKTGDTVTSLAEVYTDKNVGSGKTLNVKAGFVINDGNAGGNYIVSTVSSTAGVINPKVLTAALTGNVTKTYDGATNATLVAANYAALAGVVAGDTVSVAAPTLGAYTDMNAGAGKTVTVTGVGLTGAGSSNYVLASTTLSAAVGTINPATLTYTATPVAQTYGTAIPVLTGSVSGFVGNDTLATATSGTASWSTTAVQSSNVGSYAITGFGLTALNGNYKFVQAPANATAFKISPAVLSYLANAVTKTQGSANPALSGTVTGFVLGQTIATATTGTLAWNTNATTTSPIGSYYINGSGLTAKNGNYTFVQASSNTKVMTVR